VEQLKRRREKIRELGRGIFLPEYAEGAETCWAAAGGMFYDAELLKLLLARAPKPLSIRVARVAGGVRRAAAR
jgi:hypothetical protein